MLYKTNFNRLWKKITFVLLARQQKYFYYSCSQSFLATLHKQIHTTAFLVATGRCLHFHIQGIEQSIINHLESCLCPIFTSFKIGFWSPSSPEGNV